MPVIRPAKDNITMIAFHGSKDEYPKLGNLIHTTIHAIKTEIAKLQLPNDFFKEYVDHQIHATLIGMEVIKIGDQLCNANFLNNNGEIRPIHPCRLLELLESMNNVRDRNPLFTIRFRGFQKSYCSCKGFDLLDWPCTSGGYEFHSFERSTYEGSFYAFQEGPVMLTGWPIHASQETYSFNREVYGFRRAASESGFLDKYHLKEKPHWKDDDFYIRLGNFGKCDTTKFNSLIERVRDFLCSGPPIILDVRLDDLSIVYYEQPSVENVKMKISVLDAIKDPSLVDDLYGRWTKKHPRSVRS